MKMFQVYDKRDRAHPYQDFVCRHSLRGDNALQGLKHQCQDFTAMAVLLTAC